MPDIFLIFIILIGCHADRLNMEGITGFEDKIMKIHYGTSFGLCAGYYRRTVGITSSNLIYLKEGCSENISTLTCQSALSPGEFLLLTDRISLTGFFQLDEIIGCPDCADGGMEWIEILIPDKKPRVSFEYRNEPAVIYPYIDDFGPSFPEWMNAWDEQK